MGFLSEWGATPPESPHPGPAPRAMTPPPERAHIEDLDELRRTTALIARRLQVISALLLGVLVVLVLGLKR